MRIESDELIRYDREIVYRTYRDEIEAFIDHLPVLRGVDVLERSEEGSKVEVVNQWRAGDEVPAAIRKLLTKTIFSWREYASWDDDAYTVSWRIEIDAFKEAVQCSGVNRFIDLGDKTRLEISGDLNIDLARLKGIPSLLAEGLARPLRQFLLSQITSSLTGVAEGLNAYLKTKTNPGEAL